MLARGAYDAPTERGRARHAGGAAARSRRACRPTASAWRAGCVARAPADRARRSSTATGRSCSARGLVATPADFGSQGQLPTHPALLDWLATSFVASGWDLKALQKQIVLSATYRQSSIADAAARERDPANEWLARGPSLSPVGRAGARRRARRQRPARRDDRRAERLPVPAGRAVGGARHAQRDDLRRRARATTCIGAASTRCGSASSPPPSAISFDAAERLFCTVSRQRTSTPLQALVLLNDPQFVEAARVLASAHDPRGGRRRRRPDRARLPRC